MSDFIGICGLSVAMFVGCLLFGWIPMAFNLSQVSLCLKHTKIIILHSLWQFLALLSSLNECIYGYKLINIFLVTSVFFTLCKLLL